MPTETNICRECDRTKPIAAHGMCKGCYSRWRKAKIAAGTWTFTGMRGPQHRGLSALEEQATELGYWLVTPQTRYVLVYQHSSHGGPEWAGYDSLEEVQEHLNGESLHDLAADPIDLVLP